MRAVSADPELAAAFEVIDAHQDEPEWSDLYHAHVHGRCTRQMALNAARAIRERQSRRGDSTVA